MISLLGRALAVSVALFILALSAGSHAQDTTIAKRIHVPAGFVRATYPAGSFSNYMQSLPLKKADEILLFDGTSLEKSHALQYAGYRIFGVVDLPLLFKSDIEQCADFAMRFWSEYHKAGNNLGKLYLFDYSGTKKKFTESGKTYTGFLKWAFSCSNSFSIKKGCLAIADSQAVPGDLVVQNETGGIGHVSMIVDKCENGRGGRLYLIGYGFMPAQQFHIEKADSIYGTGGWFTIEGYYRYLKDNLDMGKPVLRRFWQS